MGKHIYKERAGNPVLESSGSRLALNLLQDVAGKRKRSVTFIRNEEGDLVEINTLKKIMVRYLDKED